MEEADKAFLGRVARLQGDLDAVQGRLWAQNDVLLRLQNDAAALKDQYVSLQERAAAALEALKTSAPSESTPFETAPSLETKFYEDAPKRSTRAWLPYAALAMAGFAMTLGMPRLYGRRAAPPITAPPPEALRAVLPIDFSARDVPPPPPIDAEVSRRDADEALNLVYDYVPPGSTRTIRELLQTQISAGTQASRGSPWVIEPAGDGRFLVTLRPGGDSASAPVYEFEVDPARRSVQPSQETEADLQSGPRLAARS